MKCGNFTKKKIRGKKTYLPQSSSHQEWNEIGNEYSQQNFFFREKTFFLDDIIDICRRFFTTGITTDLWVRRWGFSTTKASNGPFPEKKKNIQIYVRTEAVFEAAILHSALKLEKSAISKVKNTLFAFSKMAKNQFLHQEKF